MSSIIEGYNYDIFISYRQKDNRHDGWVSEFVNNLKGELESAFKEEISVYFDNNPHDGLLETHDVDASLKEKLKCLIFIPVISRTYCDPKSFAWEHEFKAFVEMASKDQFGLKVKLPNGNVASRVLPVKIHDLDHEDKSCLEEELGGHIRGIEFIYREPGVNKPLPKTDPKYSIQVNKVANTIRDVFAGLKFPEFIREVNQRFPEKKLKNSEKVITKILIGIVLGIILITAGYFAFTLIEKEPEKSIAVLPFKLLSEEPDKQYLADGMMLAITENLSKMKDLTVQGRTYTEKYRNSDKPILTIGKELHVDYLLEGNFQKFGDSVRLIIQLIRCGKKGHIWAENYDRLWKNVLKVQSEVAQAVAAELKIIITPEERQLIEKQPTGNVTAYDLYQRGVLEYDKNLETNSPQSLERAEELFNKALEYDSAFAKAYVYLARVYWRKNYWKEYFSPDFLDSVLFLANTAIKFDDKLADAHNMIGRYYRARGLSEQAVKEFDIAIKYNPNDYEAYFLKGILVRTYEDYITGVKNLENAIKGDRDRNLQFRLHELAYCYSDIGFYDKANHYYKEEFILTGDSAKYLRNLGFTEWSQGNFIEALELAKRGYSIDSTEPIEPEIFYFLPSVYDEESLQNAQDWIEYCKKTQELPVGQYCRIGYAFLKLGKKAEAKHYLEQEVRYNEAIIKLGRAELDWGAAYYHLAMAYAILEDKQKTFKYLDEWSKKKVFPGWWVMMLKHEPFFDKYRNEAQFQKIVKDVESKYNAEHERVRKWLQENNML